MSSAWKRALVIAAIVLAAVAGWFALRGGDRAPVERELAMAKAVGKREATMQRDAEAPRRVERRAKVSRAERDEIHRRILDRLERRPMQEDDVDAPALAAAPGDDAEPQPRTPIRNRLGDGDAWGDLLADLLTNDFGPLADECIADARERMPDLEGMVAIDFTVVADEEVGGVVESATPAADNEIADAGFLECMRETMLSTVLPPPPDSGRRDVTLSLRVGEE